MTTVMTMMVPSRKEEAATEAEAEAEAEASRKGYNWKRC
jgi:hypothetical protein